MAILDELLVGLGFDYDPKDLSEFNKDLNKSINLVKNLTKVAVAGATAITGLTIASTAASDEQGKLADEIDETVENIDALQFALKRSVGSADGMVNSLRQLSIRASEAARGVGSGVEAFGILGISVTEANGELKSSNTLLQEISKRFEGLNRSKQIELADKLGVRDVIRLLQQGPKAIRDLTDEAKALGVTTKEDATISAEFQDSLTDIWQITKQVSRTLSREFAPVLKDIANGLTDWWVINREIIEQNIPKFIDGVTKALKLLTITVGILLSMRLVTMLSSLVTLLKSATIGTLALNAAMAILPVLIATGITLFIGLIEDAKVFFEGGDSFIGDLINRFPEWRNEITSTAAVLATIFDLAAMSFDGWSKVIDLFKGGISLDEFESFIKTLPGFLDHILGVSEKFNKVVNFISGKIDELITKVKSILPEFGNISDSISSLFSDEEVDITATVNIDDNTKNSIDNIISSIKGTVSRNINALFGTEEQKPNTITHEIELPQNTEFQIDPVVGGVEIPMVETIPLTIEDIEIPDMGDISLEFNTPEIQDTNLSFNIDDIPSFTNMNLNIDETPEIESPNVLFELQSLPEFDNIKIELGTLPNINNIGIDVEKLPELNNIEMELGELPSVGDIEIGIGELPSVGDIEIGIGELPSVGDIEIGIGELPSVGDIEIGIGELPSVGDIEIGIGELPSVGNVKIELGELPEFNNIEIGIGELPEFNNIEIGIGELPEFNNIEIGIGELPEFNNIEIGIGDLDTPTIDPIEVMFNEPRIPTLEEISSKIGIELIPNDIVKTIGDTLGNIRETSGIESTSISNSNTSLNNITNENSKSMSLNVENVEVNVSGTGNPELVAREVVNQFQQASQDLVTVVDQ